MARNNTILRSAFFLATLCVTLVILCVPVPALDTGVEVFSTPSGANASVDNYWYNTTPATFTGIGTGYHTVTVTMDGFQTFVQPIFFTRPGLEAVNAVLQPVSPQTGNLNVKSSPAGADIWIDRMLYGETPLVIASLAPGTHTMSLVKAGYYNLTQNITIAAGQQLALSPPLVQYTASPGIGSLQIDTRPGGVACYLNNNYAGTTLAAPHVFDLVQLAPGTYTLRLTAKDYLPYIQNVTIQDNVITSVHATLVKGNATPQPDTTGQINIGSTPAGAAIYLDNTYQGSAPRTILDVPQGPHALTLRISGYPDWTTTVNVVPGNYTVVSGTLSTGQQQNPAGAVPQPTKSPVALVTTGIAIAVCCIAAILNKRRE